MRRDKKPMVFYTMALLIASIFFPVVSTLFINDGADSPVWEIGDYWNYNMYISYEQPSASADLTLNMHFEVTNDDGVHYILNFEGNVEGSVSIAGVIEGEMKNTVINGQLYIRKSDLAMITFNAHMEGEIERMFVTNAFSADIELKQNVTPAVSPYDFPIEVNETWTVPNITFWLHLEAKIELAVPYEVLYDFPVYIEEHTLTCTGIEELSVPAGIYRDGYHVSGSPHYKFWYSPIAHNTIKAEYNNIRLWYNESLYWDINELYAEMIDTNYKPQNMPPYPPTNPYPANGSTDVAIDVILSWNCSDPDDDLLTYDVYFGTSLPPSKVSSNQSATTYNPGMLEYNTTYYWKVIAFDGYNHSTPGEIWTFKTKVFANNPPDKPNRPTGPTSGEIGREYTYSSFTTDPDGDKVYYKFDWGDGSTSQWLGPFESGKIANATHVWNTMGNYTIKVKAKDEHGMESEWSDGLLISMPKKYSLFVELFDKLNEWHILRSIMKLLQVIFNL